MWRPRSRLARRRRLALDIPADAPLAEIKALLRRGEDAGWWAYEEGCIDDRWRAL
jgi:hypothetical protein